MRMAKNQDQKKGGGGKRDGDAADVGSRKRNLTLDFLTQPANKKTKYDLLKDTAPVLSSPDIKKLKLKSPEIESILLQQNTLNGATPTPSATTQILFPKAVTAEQEIYAKGFEDALHELQCSDSSQGGNFTIDMNDDDSMDSSTVTYTELDSSRPMSELAFTIKDEPQTVPCMGDSTSPIDLASQEVMKLERKRQRNRVAASKCRRRKLERISRLEEKVKGLKGENNDLHMVLMRLKDQVCLLKGQVLEHVNNGCRLEVDTFTC